MTAVVKKRKRQRGIFAIEGEWLSDLRGGLSFRPLLELMKCVNKSPFVHRDAATREELFYYLKKWSQGRYSRYPILYLGYHGEVESIIIGDGRESDFRVTLTELMEALEGACDKRIIEVDPDFRTTGGGCSRSCNGLVR